MSKEAKTVLVIDDCAEDREVCRRYLLRDDRYHYQVLEAESVQEGLELCLKIKPDAVLLDYFLPDLDGLEFLAELTNQNQALDLAVIILTGQGNDKVAVAAMQSGAQNYLVKGELTQEKLSLTVHAAIEKICLQKEIAQSQEKLRLTTEIALRIRQSLDIEDVLSTTVIEVRKLLKCDRILVYQFTPDFDGTVVAESVEGGWRKTLDHQIIDPCFMQEVAEDYRQGKKHTISDVDQVGLNSYYIELLEKFQVKASLSVPILLTESSSPTQLWGLLIAHQCSDYRQWQADELELLDKLAVQISICLQQGQLLRQLQEELAQRQQAEAELEKSQKRYVTLAELSPVGIFNADAQGNCLYTNRRWCLIAGLTPTEALGTGWSKAIHPEDRERVYQEWYQAAQNNLPFYSEYRFANCQGEITWVLGQAVAEKDEEGEIIGYVGTITDISDRKQLESELQQRVQQRTADWQKSQQELAERENLLNAFFVAAGTANVGLSIFDRQLRYIEINQALADINGLPIEAHIGKTVEEILPELAPSVLPTFQQIFNTGKAILNKEETGETPKAPGVKRTWLASYFPIFEQEKTVTAIGIIATEITEIKRIEQALQQSNEHLAQSNEELEQFAYVASHDLQEPLRKVKSFTQLLAEDYQGQLDEDADTYISYIIDGASRMQSLISDLLTYSRVSRVELDQQVTDLNSVLSQVQADLSITIAENNAVIRINQLPNVRANPVQMRQLFQNLLANSIKFRTEASPEIDIDVQQQQGQWLFSVQDNGIGIKSQYIDRIFTIFQRLHNREKYPGTGIGLAVCRKIIERHGGKIWAKSESGKGTSFYFTLPAIVE
ncbi:MAG: PAS domain S-box protein [Coleofasciculaceae cyanobacterium]